MKKVTIPQIIVAILVAVVLSHYAVKPVHVDEAAQPVLHELVHIGVYTIIFAATILVQVWLKKRKVESE